MELLEFWDKIQLGKEERQLALKLSMEQVEYEKWKEVFPNDPQTFFQGTF